MITEIIEFAGFDGHLVPICISARNSRLDGDGCFDLLDKLEFSGDAPAGNACPVQYISLLP